MNNLQTYIKMKRLISTLFVVFAVFTAMNAQEQPLLKTHVETGDVEGVLEETLAVYKAIPYAATSRSYSRHDE